MTKEEAVIISAYTGYMLVDDFGAVHEFVEKLLGRPVWTHEFANTALFEEIRKECKPILPFVSVRDCENKVVANGDRVRAMTDEELAELFRDIYNAGGEYAENWYVNGSRQSCFIWDEEWLKQPAEEE